MKYLTTIAACASLVATVAHAEGDAAAGEKVAKKCRSCHVVQDDEGNTLLKGGKTGPNLWMVVGGPAASREDFTKYGASLEAARDAGLVWTDELFLEYIEDPSKFLKTYLDDAGAKSKMTLKLKRGGEDLLAWLKDIGAVVEPTATN